MDAADESRKQWASLLAGNGSLHDLALGPWLGLAASLAEATGQGSPTAVLERPSADAGGWPAALGSLMGGWAQMLNDPQGLALGRFAASAANPLAAVLRHPAAAVAASGENSKDRLSMVAGLALTDFLQTASAHLALQMQGWFKALQRFAAEFAGAGDGEAPSVVVSSLDELMTYWGAVGEVALQEHSRSEQFLESQASLLRTSMAYRVARRRAMEAVARENDLPTLSDLDEAFAAIHELRREMRTLRQRVDAAPPLTAAAPTAAAPTEAAAAAATDALKAKPVASCAEGGMSAAQGRRKQARTRSGGSEAHEMPSVKATASAPGRPKPRTAVRSTQVI
jgi:hypothetical protein